MIQDTLLYDASDLSPLVDEALAGREPAEFIQTYLDGLKSIIGRDPRQYRSFGPYWWPLKSMLMDKGMFVGTDLENGTLQHYTMGTPELTIVAAWAYQQDRLNEGKLRSSSHQLELPGGDLYEYYLTDLDMEQAIINGGWQSIPVRQ